MLMEKLKAQSDVIKGFVFRPQVPNVFHVIYCILLVLVVCTFKRVNLYTWLFELHRVYSLLSATYGLYSEYRCNEGARCGCKYSLCDLKFEFLPWTWTLLFFCWTFIRIGKVCFILIRCAFFWRTCHIIRHAKTFLLFCFYRKRHTNKQIDDFLRWNKHAFTQGFKFWSGNFCSCFS